MNKSLNTYSLLAYSFLILFFAFTWSSIFLITLNNSGAKAFLKGTTRNSLNFCLAISSYVGYFIVDFIFCTASASLIFSYFSSSAFFASSSFLFSSSFLLYSSSIVSLICSLISSSFLSFSAVYFFHSSLSIYWV